MSNYTLIQLGFDQDLYFWDVNPNEKKALGITKIKISNLEDKAFTDSIYHCLMNDDVVIDERISSNVVSLLRHIRTGEKRKAPFKRVNSNGLLIKKLNATFLDYTNGIVKIYHISVVNRIIDKTKLVDSISDFEKIDDDRLGVIRKEIENTLVIANDNAEPFLEKVYDYSKRNKLEKINVDSFGTFVRFNKKDKESWVELEKSVMISRYANRDYTDTNYSLTTKTSATCYYNEKIEEKRSKDLSKNEIYEWLTQNVSPVGFSYYLFRILKRKKNFSETDAKNEAIKLLSEYFEKEDKKSHALSTIERQYFSVSHKKRNQIIRLGYSLELSLEEVNEFLKDYCFTYALNLNVADEFLHAYCFSLKKPYAEYERIKKDSDMLLKVNAVSTKSELSLDDIINISNDEIRENALREKLYALNQLTDQQIWGSFVKDLITLIKDAGSAITSRVDTIKKLNKKAYIKGNSNTATLEEYLKYYDFLLDPINLEKKISGADSLCRLFNIELSVDDNGNLPPMMTSSFKTLFDEFQINKKLITDITNCAFDFALEETNKTERKTKMIPVSSSTRQLVITLLFYKFVISDFADERDINKRFNCFVDQCNSELEKYGFTGLRASNPYDQFLMICVADYTPLATYEICLRKSFELSGE